jgi:hypothetical protein
MAPTHLIKSTFYCIKVIFCVEIAQLNSAEQLVVRSRTDASIVIDSLVAFISSKVIGVALKDKRVQEKHTSFNMHLLAMQEDGIALSPTVEKACSACLLGKMLIIFDRY